MNPKEKLLSKEDIVRRIHNHAHITKDQACRLKTGVLDVDLLNRAFGKEINELQECEVVAVRFAAMTMNFMTKRKDLVFDVTSSKGEHIGSFFACSFKSLHI